jgi:hypothetical protein
VSINGISRLHTCRSRSGKLDLNTNRKKKSKEKRNRSRIEKVMQTLTLAKRKGPPGPTWSLRHHLPTIADARDRAAWLLTAARHRKELPLYRRDARVRACELGHCRKAARRRRPRARAKALFLTVKRQSTYASTASASAT